MEEYTYVIDLDERGEFRAHVENVFGERIFNIDGGSIFEDGFMKHSEDLRGLEEYLVQVGLISDESTLKLEY